MLEEADLNHRYSRADALRDGAAVELKPFLSRAAPHAGASPLSLAGS
jgi:hypothetical protein